MKKVFLIFAACLLTGCGGLGKLAKQLKDDQAIVTIRIGSPWGLQEFNRVGGSTNTTIIEKDGRIIVNPRTSP